MNDSFVRRMNRGLKNQPQQSKRFVIWCLFCGVLLSTVFVFIAYRYLSTSTTDVARVELELDAQLAATTLNALLAMSAWKMKDLVDVPLDILSSARDVAVTEQTTTFSVGGKSVAVNYKEAGSSASGKLDVLFLHGASFSSQTWKDIGTLQLVAAMGLHTVAIDLPGYGKSASQKVKDEAAFMESLVATLKLDRPVLICASMSGGYALPFVLKPDATGSCTERVRGFVPVAPVGTSDFSPASYRRCKAPTLIVYGERDRGAPVETLRQMVNHKVFEMKNAGHACYMNDTPEWHRLLYNFLRSLEHN